MRGGRDPAWRARAAAPVAVGYPPTAGRVGRAGDREQGGKPDPAPVIAEPAPALPAVKVRDRLSVHQRAQLPRSEAGRSFHVAAD